MRRAVHAAALCAAYWQLSALPSAELWCLAIPLLDDSWIAGQLLADGSISSEHWIGRVCAACPEQDQQLLQKQAGSQGRAGRGADAAPVQNRQNCYLVLLSEHILLPPCCWGLTACVAAAALVAGVCSDDQASRGRLVPAIPWPLRCKRNIRTANSARRLFISTRA